MSEHPELREAERQRLQIEMANTVYERGPGWERTVSHAVADALLAGPVGKLQAELAEAQAELVQLREEKSCQFVIRSDEGTAYCSLAERPDPERIRREAIGAWVADMRERIAAKVPELLDASSGLNLSARERDRLWAKSTGVELALSFIDEHVRAGCR